MSHERAPACHDPTKTTCNIISSHKPGTAIYYMPCSYMNIYELRIIARSWSEHIPCNARTTKEKATNHDQAASSFSNVPRLGNLSVPPNSSSASKYLQWLHVAMPLANPKSPLWINVNLLEPFRENNPYGLRWTYNLSPSICLTTPFPIARALLSWFRISACSLSATFCNASSSFLLRGGRKHSLLSWAIRKQYNIIQYQEHRWTNQLYSININQLTTGLTQLVSTN